MRADRSEALPEISRDQQACASEEATRAPGIDLQQVSIATLIIALGLLVDDPVVANDAIKRDLATGLRPQDAAWLGPTKLARAILYATLTNIIAHLPFLMIKGNIGDFVRSYHRGRHHPGPLPAGQPRRTVVEAIVLRADRGTGGRDLHHLLLVPVFDSIAVLDLKIVKWGEGTHD